VAGNEDIDLPASNTCSMCSNCSLESSSESLSSRAAALRLLQVRLELASVPASKLHKKFFFFGVVKFTCNANLAKLANITRNKR
jgi:hypothetical protein